MLFFLLLPSLKWGKIATTGGTMLLSLAIYASIGAGPSLQGSSP
jgi:hypothetical protein